MTNMNDGLPAADDALAPQPPPVGWQATTLGEICLQVPKVRPYDEPAEAFTYLDIASIDNTAYRVVAPKSYLGRDAPSRARQKVRAGNTLFSTVRTYLKNVAMVPTELDGQVASTGFCVLNPSDEIEPGFVFYHVVSDDFVSNLNPLQRGTNYPAVRDDDVLTQRIDLPPLPEQRRIVAEIETQFTRLDACQGRRKTVPLGRRKAGPPGWCLTARGGVGPPALTTVRRWHPRGANRRLTGLTRARRRRPAGCPGGGSSHRSFPGCARGG